MPIVRCRFVIICISSNLHKQYRGTISENSEVAVGLLLFAANLIMILGPFVIICLVAFRALPNSIVQRFFGDDAPQITTADAATTDRESTNKVPIDYMFEHFV